MRKGAKAQEEDLCRKSSLILSLESDTARKYYNYNSNLHTRMGSDAVMITPKVEIIKDDRGNLLDDSVIVSVMTCAAPDLRFGREGMSQQKYEDLKKSAFHEISVTPEPATGTPTPMPMVPCANSGSGS